MCIFTVNIALNKPAYLQYQYRPDDKIYDASNAVDGRKSDLRLGGGQCASSEPQQTATWWVNLTRIYSIHHITIFYVTGNKSWGMVIYFFGPWYQKAIPKLVRVDNRETTNALNSLIYFSDFVKYEWTTVQPIWSIWYYYSIFYFFFADTTISL